MKQFLLIAAIALSIAGCSKKDDNFSQPQQPQLPVDDARTVLLKEIVSQTLPNPYFHFTYDSLHYVTQINFASGFSICNVEYENKRVKKLTNIKNGNSLFYTYNDNRVSEINEFSGVTGDKIFSYRLYYNNRNQLSELVWLDFHDADSGVPYKKTLLTYHADGNLASVNRYYLSAGELAWTTKEQFSNYDDKINVDDFYLLEDFFDTHLFLPQVKLQKNNPTKQQIMGTENDFEILYNYQYQNNLPVKKNGTMTQTRGTGNGQSIQISSRFNYY